MTHISPKTWNKDHSSYERIFVLHALFPSYLWEMFYHDETLYQGLGKINKCGGCELKKMWM